MYTNNIDVYSKCSQCFKSIPICLMGTLFINTDRMCTYVRGHSRNTLQQYTIRSGKREMQRNERMLQIQMAWFYSHLTNRYFTMPCGLLYFPIFVHVWKTKILLGKIIQDVQ